MIIVSIGLMIKLFKRVMLGRTWPTVLSKSTAGFPMLSYLSNNSSKLVPYCLDYCNECYCESLSLVLILDWYSLDLVLIMDIVRQNLLPKLLTLVDDRGIFIFSENSIKYHRYFITDHFSERGICLLTWQKVTEGPKDFYISLQSIPTDLIPGGNQI